MKVINLFGGPSAGKCLGKGTPILMFDGTVKAVEDIVVGDAVMGPDSTKRLVTRIFTGTDQLYYVNPQIRKG